MIPRLVVAVLILASEVVAVLCAQEAREFVRLASAAYQNQEYHQCAEYYQQAIEKGAKHPDTFYNAACCCAMDGNVEQAIDYLTQSVEKGYREVEWLAQDMDLDILHGDARWDEIVKKCQANLEAYLATINEELYRMFQEDQTSRMVQDIEWEIVHEQDIAHRERTRELIEAGELKAADDYFHAAMIFQHGEDSTDYQMAYELALKAFELDSTNSTAKWLAAAAWDRYLWSVRKPQWYGTQFQMLDGEWTMEPIDTTAVTDEERARWFVPRLEEARKRAEKISK